MIKNDTIAELAGSFVVVMALLPAFILYGISIIAAIIAVGIWAAFVVWIAIPMKQHMVRWLDRTRGTQ